MVETCSFTIALGKILLLLSAGFVFTRLTNSSAKARGGQTKPKWDLSFPTQMKPLLELDSPRDLPAAARGIPGGPEPAAGQTAALRRRVFPEGSEDAARNYRHQLYHALEPKHKNPPDPHR